MKSVFYKTVCMVALCSFCRGRTSLFSEICDKRPLGTKTDPLPPDDRFVIEIKGVGTEYIPNSNYRVILKARDGQSTFIAFTISAKEDNKENEKNPRKPLALDTGKILPTPDSKDGVLKENCNNTVIEADVTPKKSVEVTWRAPPKNNKCVTIYALVAVKKDVWYDYEGPLSKKVCEDRRKNEDMPPLINDDKCYICEDARYQLTFEGTWSYNTHLLMFPTNHELARFSDVVGASHSREFQLFKLNREASEGLTMLAESGNTTQLEIEIQRDLTRKVRTVIKANGQSKTNTTTVSSFRASSKHHRVSLVAGILPSPDWFLGVADFELCSTENGQWTPERSLNLYPLDAGTDSGTAFDSPNERTSPPQVIAQAIINRNVPEEEIRPFARLHFKLIRTYSKPSCPDTDLKPSQSINGEDESTGSGSDTSEGNDEDQGSITTTSEEPAIVDPNSNPNCLMTQWEEWLPCEGKCENGRVTGFSTRLRYHLIDGVAVGKYVENGPQVNKELPIPSDCRQLKVNEIVECEEECTEIADIEQNTSPRPIVPGENWAD